jgi:uracil-DNA glycosylase
MAVAQNAAAMQEWPMDALTLLRLQIEWGADEALEDAPVDRLRARGRQGEARGQASDKGLPLPLRAEAAEQSRVGGRGPNAPDPTPQPWSASRPKPSTGGGHAYPDPDTSPRPSPPPTTHPPLARPTATATAVERAAAAAGQARTIKDLRAALAAFDGCALRDTAANLVFAAGDPDAALMLIGEPPGEAEDRSGTPFAGPDGILLDRMLASIGLSRDALLRTPLIPWRPPGGRQPNPAEIAVCLPFLHRLIALAAPRRLVLAGTLAARSLSGPTRRRGAPAWIDLAVPGLPTPIPALAMPSPLQVVRTPASRREAWAALRLLRRTLDADLTQT